MRRDSIDASPGRNACSAEEYGCLKRFAVSRDPSVTTYAFLAAAIGQNITVSVVTPWAGWTVVPAISAEPEGPDISKLYALSRKWG